MPAKRKDEKKEEDVQESVSVFIFQDGSRYDGQVFKKEGMPLIRHGCGLFIDGDCTYDGQWRDDAMSGEGTMQFSTGACYVGNFHESRFEGQGRYTWPDGSYYEGEWRNNVMHGHGCYTDKSGQRWWGRFYNGAGEKLLQEYV